MSSARRMVALVASTALAAAALAVAASALADSTFSTHLTLSHKAPAFHGKVFSPGGGICTGHRRVKMFQKRSGPDKLLGKTRSHNGKWLVSHPNFPSGEYYAKVKVGGSAALGITCKPDKSNVVVVD